MARVLPQDPAALEALRATAAGLPSAQPTQAGPAHRTRETDSERTLRRALAATANGVTISDVTRPDQPLIYVNTAFERLSGLRAEDVIGRNCRFLQGEGTDRDAVKRLREAIADGREIRETMLNYRGPERTPWWNEIYLAPVFDDTGRVVQYIGVQNDVTARVEAEARLTRERERAEAYAAEIEQLAWRDPLTGVLNRRRVQEALEGTILHSQMSDTGAALLYLDLDGFKGVNDDFGHAAGDELLRVTAERLRARLRRGDLIARLGGDEFLVILPGLDQASAGVEGRRVADELAAILSEPVRTGRGLARVRASIGVSSFPQDGSGFDELLHAADTRMYAIKNANRSSGLH
nr:diguanylate cyclase [Motilibacter aurantiacus]